MSTEAPEYESLIRGALDGELSEAARARLNELLRAEPGALQSWCQQSRLHALLQWRSGSVPVMSEGAPTEAKPTAFPPKPRWRWWSAAAAALVTLGAVFFLLTPASASAALARVMEAMQRGDRSYRIEVLEGDARQMMNNGNSVTYEGAALHLRGDRQFVLVRPIIEGGQRFTGSDGTENWDFSGSGPVKVSRDPKRFRGGLPGEQQDAVFLDLRGQLSHLQSGYDISLEDAPDNADLAMLKARKKDREVRGPNEMRLTFRRESGVIVTLEMHGLPRARGGPDALRLTLTSDTALPPDFFSHAAHHEPGRPVEDADKPATRP